MPVSHLVLARGHDGDDPARNSIENSIRRAFSINT